jgi:hypothetical protein
MLARASRRVSKQGLCWFTSGAPTRRLHATPRRVSACAAAGGIAPGRAPIADDGISSFARDFMRHARRGIGAAEEDRPGATKRAPRIVELPTHGWLDPWSLDPQRAAHDQGAHAAGTHTVRGRARLSRRRRQASARPRVLFFRPPPRRNATTRPSPPGGRSACTTSR